MREGVWNDACVLRLCQTHHSMSLATASLAVCKDCAIITADDRFDEWECCLVVDLALGRVGTVDGIVGEYFLFWASLRSVRPYDYLVRWLVDFANALAA